MIPPGPQPLISSNLSRPGNLNGNSESGSDIMIGLTPQHGRPVGRFMFKLGLLEAALRLRVGTGMQVPEDSVVRVGANLEARRASLTRRSPSRNRFLR